jgi:hypothetical protein
MVYTLEWNTKFKKIDFDSSNLTFLNNFGKDILVKYLTVNEANKIIPNFIIYFLSKCDSLEHKKLQFRH